MPEIEKLTQMQLDALKEICNISAGNAATVTSQMVKKKISMSVPNVSIVPITRVGEAIGNLESLVAGVYFKILGDLSGGFLLTYPRENVFTLCDVLLGKERGTTKLLDEMDKSALQETGNIIASAFVNALSKILDRNLLITVPRFAYDMMGAVIDFVLIELAGVAEHALVVEIVFADIPETIRCRIFILPNTDSLELLLKAVDMELNNG